MEEEETMWLPASQILKIAKKFAQGVATKQQPFLVMLSTDKEINIQNF